MENKFNLKKALPYISAVLAFLLISLFYFPAQLEGKKLMQHDKKAWLGSTHEIVEYQKTTGEHSFWTNSMFGGMPTYLVTNYSKGSFNGFLLKILDLGHKLRPASFVFMLLLGFFIALLLFGLDPWLSLIGALAYGFSSYFLIIIEAGHITKVEALAFMPVIIASIYHAYRKNVWVGAIVMTIFLAVQILVNHLQITYYTLLLAGIYFIFELIRTFKEKTFKKFIQTTLVLTFAASIALMTNAEQIMTVYSYGKDSIRGKSELSDNQHNKTSGLDKDYATAWSYGKLETFNLLIPNLMGGASTGELSKNSNTYKLLKRLGVQGADQIIKNLPLYWGPQPFTSGPVYVGAIVIFFFILGMFLYKGDIKWWLFTATIFSFLLAWGKNFMPLTNLFLDYFPMYNKFRTVSMILIIAEFTMPLLAFLTLKEILDGKIEKNQLFKAIKWSLMILGGIILFLMIPGVLSFKSPQDASVFNGWPQELINAILKDRAAMFRKDAFRAAFFILASAGILWAYSKNILKKKILLAALGFLLLIDLAGVDKRYLNDDDFVPKSKNKQAFVASPADNFILQDKEPDFRVLNLTVNIFNDATTSYFHKSVGGYHAAKLRRYQDLIDNLLQNEISILIATLQQQNVTEQQIQNTLAQLQGLNMLNTKYIIVNPQAAPIVNTHRLGNAWFVDKIKTVKNADEEIAAVQNFDPSTTAIVDERFKEYFFDFAKDTTATIKLTEYRPNYLSYQTTAKSDQLAVFSEIYYAKGWQAYIDGQPAPHFRANYVLRAMRIPAGNHKIEFKFDPKIWHIGYTIAITASILMILFIGFVLFFQFRKNKASQTTEK